MDDFRRKPVNRIKKPAKAGVPSVYPPIAAPVTKPTPTPTSPSNPSGPFRSIHQAPVKEEPPIPPTSTPQPSGVNTGFKPQPITKGPNGDQPQKPSVKRLLLWAGGIIGGILLLIGIGVFGWYQIQLLPADGSKTNKILVRIESGASPSEIAGTLRDENLIRSQTAFLWHAKITGVENMLQAGTYRLSPSESTPQIIEHLTNGNVDTFDITFLPGATLEDNRKVFLDAGYTDREIDDAFNTVYDSPLFEGKPTSADLEGYIYGDTYRFGAGASAEEVLEHIFEKFYEDIEEHDLVAKFKAQGLTLFQGITLASIVQKESSKTDQAQIAQVFYLRLERGMPLGSDVTYQYIADKLGVERDINIDSPYNTRRYPGLPPGPVAVPGLEAMKNTANPAKGDYLYFVSGDDDVTYFSRSLEEHEQNVRDHCKMKCQII